MIKVVITGATGFIGGNLCKVLLGYGYEVYGIGRNKTKLDELSQNPQFHGINLDFDNYDSICKIIKSERIDYFIHAALSGVNGIDKKSYEIQLKNVMISCDVVKMAKKLGCKRFVFIGSVDEFETCFTPEQKFVKPNHSRIYGLSKFVAENIGKVLALDLNIEYVSALLSLTYGEGNKTNILPNMIIRNAESKTAMNLIKGDSYFDMIYIQDAVEAIVSIMTKGVNMESYFVGHEELKTFKEYVKEICEVLKTDIDLNFGTYKDFNSMVRYENIDRNKLKIDTGFECTISIEEGIRNTKNWLCKID